ncbi:MAG: hypothetical protein U1A78_15380 [Polyangia bacterium]
MSTTVLCRRCPNPIGEQKRSDSIYCSDRCRREAASDETKQQNRARKLYERSIPTQFAPWLREFEQLVRQHAPPNAVGYQTGLWVGDRYLWLPIVLAGKDALGRDRTRLTFFRKRTTDEFFLLNPFEPPSVPLATHYKIRFVSRIYPHPHLDEEGSFIQVIPYEIKQSNLPVGSLKHLPTSRQKR